MEYQGIVIKNSHYKDNDAMITILTSSGLASFLAKGVYKVKSKNARALALYSYGCYELLDGKYNNTLKTATVSYNVLNAYSSFDSLTSLSLIGEATFCAVSEFDTFNIMDEMLMAIKSIEEGVDPFLIAFEYISILLKKTGYGLDITKFTKINSEEKEFIKKVSDLVKIDDSLVISSELLKELLRKVVIYFNDSFGVTLNSSNLIL